MSYDFSSESRRLELPNPYRLQNQLLWICAALLMSAGITSLWWSKQALEIKSLQTAAIPAVTGLILLALSLACAARAANRLRFFFGRGRPQSLAPELLPRGAGASPESQRIKELLRQGALTYPEPDGAIAGLLYHWVPRLITAPLTVQKLAQRHFFNLAALLTTASSFVFAWGIFGTHQTRDWIALFYFAFGSYGLLKPMLSHRDAVFSNTSMLILISGAILGPVAVTLATPHLPQVGISFHLQAIVMLVAAIGACGLGILAALGQIDDLPTTHASAVQHRLSMNGPPAALIDELDRLLQSEWTERIPNRRYARIEPITDAETPSGSFSGELFEETQPLPISGTSAPTFSSAISSRQHRALLVLDIFATLLLISSAGFALFFAHFFDPAKGWLAPQSSPLGIAIILALVAGLCFQISAGLWGRFNFESTLIWVEVMGNYQTSHIGTGNQLSGHLNTQNNVIRTESMTLRIWRARIESVVFGKDGARQITAMFSTDAEAHQITERLVSFARNQSVLVAPGSPEDLARMATLGHAESALVAQRECSLAALAQPGRAPPLPSVQPGGDSTRGGPFCQACGYKLAVQARFCSNCGEPLGLTA